MNYEELLTAGFKNEWIRMMMEMEADRLRRKPTRLSFRQRLALPDARIESDEDEGAFNWF